MNGAPLLTVGRTLPHGMFSSVTVEWATPRSIFEMLHREFHFTLDVCATEQNRKCDNWFGSGALDRPWVPVENGAVWCNPPYGKEIGKWVEKAFRDSELFHQCIVLLIPARTDTQWWHAYCMNAREIRFVRGRIYFEGQRIRGRAPFPSAVVVFGPKGGTA